MVPNQRPLRCRVLHLAKFSLFDRYNETRQGDSLEP